MSDSMKEVVDTLDPVTRRILPQNIKLGTLVPLKTTLELRDNLCLGEAYVTRAPTKATNDVVTVARNLSGDEATKNLPHLRRCCKPSDLPPHVKAQFMNEGNGRAIHTGKSNWLYIMLGPKDQLPYEELVTGLTMIDAIRDDIFLGVIPVPLLAPTSQVQANMWSQQFWQTVYRKNNPLGPHPSSVCRNTSVVARDAMVWMTLAHEVAKEAQESGLGEPVGAIIIKRTAPVKPEAAKASTEKAEGDKSDETPGAETGDLENTNEIPGPTLREGDRVKPPGEGSVRNVSASDDGVDPVFSSEEKTQIVALAADARWHQQKKVGQTGNPSAHAALRAISMVAQKLVRAEDGPLSTRRIMEFEAFQDKPLLGSEQVVFDADHPSPDGYLCHDLELYMTHEPCTMCAMAILHSRMGRIVFRHRMPLTGGMSSEDRGHNICGEDVSDSCENPPCGGGQGLGLHWRKELNWSMYGWEWEPEDTEHLAVDPHGHV